MYFFCLFVFSPFLSSVSFDYSPNPNPKIQDTKPDFQNHKEHDQTTDSNARHLVIEGIKIPNPRSHDFGNALWHHRNIDKTSESRHLVVEGIKIPNPRSHDFANALWHHRNVDKTSGSRPLVVEGIKIPNPISTKIIKNPRSKIQDSTSKNPRLTNIQKCNSSRAGSFWSVVTFLSSWSKQTPPIEGQEVLLGMQQVSAHNGLAQHPKPIWTHEEQEQHVASMAIMLSPWDLQAKT